MRHQSWANRIRLQISLQRRRDFDGAVGLLMSFNEGDEQAGEGCPASVEDVRKAVVAGIGLEAEIHAASLEILAIRAARDFEVSALPRCPDFNVISFGAAKAD